MRSLARHSVALGYFACSFQEQIERLFGIGAGLGHPDLVQLLLSLGLQSFGELVEHIGRFMDQQRCSRQVG